MCYRRARVDSGELWASLGIAQLVFANWGQILPETAGNFPLLRSHRQEEEKEAVVLKEEMLILRGAGICVAARAWRA